MKRCHLLRSLLFFPINRETRFAKHWRDRSRFWHRIAARIAARRILKNRKPIKLVSREGTYFTVYSEELASFVLSEVAEYDVDAQDLV